MIGAIHFTDTTLPDGGTGRVMALSSLSGRPLVLPVEVPDADGYAFSVWVKCSQDGSVEIDLLGTSRQFEIGTSWQRLTLTAEARSENEVLFTPGTDDEYFLYQAMLETGNKPGDWSPSPQDDEDAVKDIRQSLLELTPEAIIATVMNSRSMTSFRQEADRVAILVDGSITEDGATRVHNSAVLIDTGGIEMRTGGELRFLSGDETRMALSGEGIDMKTAGKVNIHAQNEDGSIIFGTDKGNAAFSVTDKGQLTAKTVSANAFHLNGSLLPSLVVSASRPEGHNILWFLPTSTTEKSWSRTPEYPSLKPGGSLGYYRDYDIPYEAADYLAGTQLLYGIQVSLYCYHLQTKPKNVTLRASLLTANGSIEIGQVTERLSTDGNYVNLNVVPSVPENNLMSPSGGCFTVRIESSASSGESRLVLGPFSFKARTTAASGVSACSLYYIP